MGSGTIHFEHVVQGSSLSRSRPVGYRDDASGYIVGWVFSVPTRLHVVDTLAAVISCIFIS